MYARTSVDPLTSPFHLSLEASLAHSSLDSSPVAPLLFFTRIVVCSLPRFLLTHLPLLSDTSPSHDVPPSDEPSSADELSSMTASSSSVGDAPPPPAHGFHARPLLVVDCYDFSAAAHLEPRFLMVMLFLPNGLI